MNTIICSEVCNQVALYVEDLVLRIVLVSISSVFHIYPDQAHDHRVGKQCWVDPSYLNAVWFLAATSLSTNSQQSMLHRASTAVAAWDVEGGVQYLACDSVTGMVRWGLLTLLSSFWILGKQSCPNQLEAMVLGFSKPAFNLVHIYCH